MLVKDDKLNCFDDILAYIKKLPEPEKSMINEIITICKLLLVKPEVENVGPLENNARQVQHPDSPQQS